MEVSGRKVHRDGEEMSIVYNPEPGTRIDLVLTAAIVMAEIAQDTVELHFNGKLMFIDKSYQRYLLRVFHALEPNELLKRSPSARGNDKVD